VIKRQMASNSEWNCCEKQICTNVYFISCVTRKRWAI